MDFTPRPPAPAPHPPILRFIKWSVSPHYVSFGCDIGPGFQFLKYGSPTIMYSDMDFILIALLHSAIYYKSKNNSLLAY
jgi:hypothetical protein